MVNNDAYVWRQSVREQVAEAAPRPTPRRQSVREQVAEAAPRRSPRRSVEAPTAAAAGVSKSNDVGKSLAVNTTVEGLMVTGGPFDTELTRLGPFPQAFLVSQGIVDVQDFLTRTTKDLAPALVKFVNDNKQNDRSVTRSPCTTQKWIARWHRDLIQRRKTLKEGVQGLDPTFEVFDATVRSFFADKKITKPRDLLRYRGLGRFWMAWRLENSLTGVNESTARKSVTVWRQSVKEQVAVEVSRSNADALDFDELARLGPMPRAFFASEGITDVTGFLSREVKSLVPVLVKFVEREGQRTLPLNTTGRWIARWHRDLIQRRKTLKEGLQCLDPTFEVFNEDVRSFFAAKSIVDPHGLLTCQTLSGDWVAWWLEKYSTVVSARSASNSPSDWRRSVKEQIAVGPEVEPPVKRRRRTGKRKVAIRTSPWLLLGVSAESAAASQCTAFDGSGIDGSDAENPNANSGHAQKRARLEESVARTGRLNRRVSSRQQSYRASLKLSGG